LNIFPHELLADLRQTGRLATRVFGHALGPWAALAALFSLRLIRHFHALRRVWLVVGVHRDDDFLEFRIDGRRFEPIDG
jgi:hypothetical protein